MSLERDAKLKQLYLEGKTRREAMDACGIKNTNSMSSASSRLYLHWSWPLENRKSGVKPEAGLFAAPSARSHKRKGGDRGGGTVHAINAQTQNAATPATKSEVPAGAPLRLVDSGPKRHYYGPPTVVLTHQRRERGYQDDDFEFGGRLSPFPTPSEVSLNPDDLSRAEIHALASLYR